MIADSCGPAVDDSGCCKYLKQGAGKGPQSAKCFISRNCYFRTIRKYASEKQGENSNGLFVTVFQQYISPANSLRLVLKRQGRRDNTDRSAGVNNSLRDDRTYTRVILKIPMIKIYPSCKRKLLQNFKNLIQKDQLLACSLHLLGLGKIALNAKFQP